MRNIVSTHSRIIGIIPDIRSHSDQWDSTIFRISILIQTSGILLYSGYPFLFRPGDSTIFRISVLFQTRGDCTIIRISILIQTRGFYNIMCIRSYSRGFYNIPDICSYSDQGGFYNMPDIRSNSEQGVPTIFRISVLIQTRGVLQYFGYPF